MPEVKMDKSMPLAERYGYIEELEERCAAMRHELDRETVEAVMKYTLADLAAIGVVPAPNRAKTEEEREGLNKGTIFEMICALEAMKSKDVPQEACGDAPADGDALFYDFPETAEEPSGIIAYGSAASALEENGIVLHTTADAGKGRSGKKK